jgi:hypothetical protein
VKEGEEMPWYTYFSYFVAGLAVMALALGVYFHRLHRETSA